MILNRTDPTCFTGRTRHQIFIDRPDGGHVDHGDTFLYQACHLQGFDQNRSRTDQSDVSPLLDSVSFADLELSDRAHPVGSALRSDKRRWIPTYPEIDGNVILQYLFKKQVSLNGIRRFDDHNARKNA